MAARPPAHPAPHGRDPRRASASRRPTWRCGELPGRDQELRQLSVQARCAESLANRLETVRRPFGPTSSLRRMQTRKEVTAMHAAIIARTCDARDPRERVAAIGLTLWAMAPIAGRSCRSQLPASVLSTRSGELNVELPFGRLGDEHSSQSGQVLRPLLLQQPHALSRGRLPPPRVVPLLPEPRREEDADVPSRSSGRRSAPDRLARASLAVTTAAGSRERLHEGRAPESPGSVGERPRIGGEAQSGLQVALEERRRGARRGWASQIVSRSRLVDRRQEHLGGCRGIARHQSVAAGDVRPHRLDRQTPGPSRGGVTAPAREEARPARTPPVCLRAARRAG